jgi:hypothetical protein
MVEVIWDRVEGFSVKYALRLLWGCFVFGIFLGEFLERGSFARTTLDRVLREVCRRDKAFSVIITGLMYASEIDAGCVGIKEKSSTTS